MIYFDNAATSFPKPPQVARAMAGTLEKLGANPGRSGHRLSLCAGRIVNACREEAALLLGVEQPERVIFTGSCTEALNLAILGTLHQGDEVLCSHAEHNAVMRPLHHLAQTGQIHLTRFLRTISASFSPTPCRLPSGRARRWWSSATPATSPAWCSPCAVWERSCKEHGVPLLVDAAQTAGVLDVRLDALNADMVAMPGHKGLLGPQGIGLLALGPGMEPLPLIRGGTGSSSESLEQPDDLPDRYESGTLPLPAIAGLLQGIRFARKHQAEIHEYESYLNTRLRQGLSTLPGVTCLGHPDAPRVGITSFVHTRMDGGELTDCLDRSGFALRGGLHCAPSVHTWLGTLQSGAVRASVGIYNTEEEVDGLIALVERLTKA